MCLYFTPTDMLWRMCGEVRRWGGNINKIKHNNISYHTNKGTSTNLYPGKHRFKMCTNYSSVLPRKQKSWMYTADRKATNTTTTYKTAKLLPWIYRSQMSQTNTNTNDRKTQMFSGFTRFQMSQTNTNNRNTQMLSWINRSKMPQTTTINNAWTT